MISSNVQFCIDWFTRYWCVSFTIRNGGNFREKKKSGLYFLITFLPRGMLKTQNFEHSQITIASSIGNGLPLYWQFWLPSRFLIRRFFKTKCEKLLQSVTKRESFTKFKIVIAKCYKNYYKLLKLLKSVTRGYYKV